MCAILDAKLSNQRALLLYHSKYQRRGEGIRRCLLDSADAVEDYRRQAADLGERPMRHVRRALFLVEAKAAAHYWRGFGALITTLSRS